MRSAELVGVAQTIACCGEIGGIGHRCEIAQLLQPFGLADIHAAVLGLPVVKRRFRHAMLARQIAVFARPRAPSASR